MTDHPSPPALLHLAVSLDGAGAHPAAWRDAGADPTRLLDADRLVSLARTAARGTLDFVVFEDTFIPEADRADVVRGRLDALLVAARVAPATEGIGLIPTVTTTHTEPFHVSKNVATLDLVSGGRGGWKVAISRTADEAQLFGRKAAAAPAELFEEAAEAVDVVRRLWDSWEDDAVIRDVPTGRYLDRDRVHYVDFQGEHFSVRGPSITPRPPQGQPIVAIDAVSTCSLGVGARWADVVVLHAPDLAAAHVLRTELRRRIDEADRDAADVRVLVAVDVLLAADEDAARAERFRLDALADPDEADDGADGLRNVDFVGSPAGLAALLEHWFVEGAADGFVIRPAVLPTGLDLLVDDVVPRLRDRELFRTAYAGTTLRDHLGLDRPPDRYAPTADRTLTTS